MSSSHVTLGAAADDRKAKLAKLKSLKRKQPSGEVAAPESTRSPSPPALSAAAAAEEAAPGAPDVAALHLSGRNYDVESKGPKLGFEAPPTLSDGGPTLEEQAAAVEAETRQRAAAEAAEADTRGIDLFKLQPKKPNWDLKRDLDKKLEALNVRTDNAIAKLVRDRIASKQQAATAQTTTTTTPGKDDAALGDGEAAGLDGVALVEGLRLREREDEEEGRREKEEDGLV